MRHIFSDAVIGVLRHVDFTVKSNCVLIGDRYRVAVLLDRCASLYDFDFVAAPIVKSIHFLNFLQ